MKIKTLVAMLFLSAGATTVVAQDATNCNSNSSISHEAVRAGNFKDAYTPWKAVLENCPTLRFYTFTDGYKILKGLMGQIKDRNNPEYQKYFDELMNTHDLRIKYTDEFLAKGTKVSSADEAFGIKAVDYIAFAPKIDVNQAYQWLSQSVNAVKAESAAATIFYFLQMSLDKLKTDPNHKEQFIQDYLAASEYADAGRSCRLQHLRTDGRKCSPQHPPGRGSACRNDCDRQSRTHPSHQTLREKCSFPYIGTGAECLRAQSAGRTFHP